MALKSLFSTLLIAILAAGCSRSAAPEAAPEEPEALSVTRWTEKTELFAEYPPLAVGSTSRFAIHLTRLDGFKALTEGNVEVRLEGGSAQPEVFRVDAPSRPGIFGRRRETRACGQAPARDRAQGHGIERRTSGWRQSMCTRTLKRPVLPRRAGGEDAPGISFLKEQQWSLDFGTALVKEQAVRESIRVPARLEARPGGAADVVAPIDGRLTRRRRGRAWRERVSRAGTRAIAAPTLGASRPSAAAAGARGSTNGAGPGDSRSRASRAANDRRRGAGRRLDEARSAEEQAKARLTAAEASLAQYNAARTGGATDAEGLFIVRAPVSGVIAQRDAATGANVTAGSVLFRVVDAAQVHVVGQVPEATGGARAPARRPPKSRSPGNRIACRPAAS